MEEKENESWVERNIRKTDREDKNAGEEEKAEGKQEHWKQGQK